jgi:hypothetical protein
MKMKSFLLGTITLLTISGNLWAQNFPPDYRLEFGINGGIAPFTLPKGVDPLYRGSATVMPATESLNFQYNISQNWQVGGDLGITSWKTKTTWPLNDANNQQLQSGNVTINIAKPEVGFCAQLNRVKAYYSEYKEFNKANLYYGVSLGLAVTVNDGGMANSLYNQTPDPNYTYTSQYNYGYGIGYIAGVQVGFTYYVIEHLGFNIELAGRYTDIGTSDTRYDHENARFNLMYFPCKVGLRLRF